MAQEPEAGERPARGDEPASTASSDAALSPVAGVLPASSSEPSQPAESDPTGPEALAITVILSGVLLLSVLGAVAGRWPPAGVEIERLPERRYEYRVDVNTANSVELQHLPNIGPKRAEQIIAERERGGPFRSLDDLGRVPGIGPRTLEQLAPYVTMKTKDGRRKDEG